jgi:hypothetical protein
MTLMALAVLSDAAHINHDQKGQIALLPYYTVNNNFITNFTVTNRSSMFKAVRVRLLDSRISADLLNINLYLSPFDTWNATLRKDPASGLPNLITEDESCTYPDKQQLQAGITFENPYAATTDEDLTEGYIEIIEMGDIADGPGPAADNDKTAEIDGSGSADGVLTDASGDRSIPDNIIAQANDLPLDCSVIADAWSAGAASSTTINGFESGALSTEGIAEDTGIATEPYDNSQNAGLVTPSGGISAYGIMINIAQGTAYVQQAVHIDGYTSVAQHYLPDDPLTYRLPSLASGNIREAYVTNQLGDDRKGDTMPLTEYDTGALQDISPRPSVPMGSNPLPISLILSADSISAPFFLNTNSNGLTDVVLTFPMRKFGIYNGGILSNQTDLNQAACQGVLNDGNDDGRTVHLTALDATVHDYPYNEDGSFCDNAGYTDLVTNNSFERYSADTTVLAEYYDYETNRKPVWNDDSWGVTPLDAMNGFVAERSINVTTLSMTTLYQYHNIFGTSTNDTFGFNIFSNYQAGTVRIELSNNLEPIYDYSNKASISALTEPLGSLGSGINNGWTGVPVIGFAAIYSETQNGHLGETVELQRQTNRQ